MKVNKWDGSAASSEQELLKEWRSYFDLLLNNDNGITPHPSSSRGPDKHWLPNSRGDLWSNCSHKNNQGHCFGLCHYCWGTAWSNAWCHSRHVLLLWSLYLIISTTSVNYQCYHSVAQERWPLADEKLQRHFSHVHGYEGVQQDLVKWNSTTCRLSFEWGIWTWL